MFTPNYEKDIEIDHSQLDVMCLDHPNLVFQYSKLSAKIEKDYDLLKDELNYEKAVLESKIRKNPSDYGIEKVTEGAISMVINQDKVIGKLVSDLYHKKEELSMVEGMVRALQDRKSMLELLVKLHGVNYFAGPSMPRNLDEIRERVNQNNNEKIVSQRRRNN